MLIGRHPWHVYTAWSMATDDFSITFTGTAARFAALSRFLNRLVSTKARIAEGAADPGTVEAVIRDAAWVDLLDDAANEKLTGANGWRLEDLLECVLRGEYLLVGVTFDGREGRLVYDPWAYPFGGTDALIALVEVFGLEVTRDSFRDGFAEWRARNAR
jgi:hypothetical protein